MGNLPITLRAMSIALKQYWSKLVSAEKEAEKGVAGLGIEVLGYIQDEGTVYGEKAYIDKITKALFIPANLAEGATRSGSWTSADSTWEPLNVKNNKIESGSNSLGEYIKYPDGTLICYAKTISGLHSVAGEEYAPLRYYTSVGWTFPYSFKIGTVPTVNLNLQANTHIGGVGGIQSLSNLSIQQYIKGSSLELVEGRALYWVAIGRWK